MNHITLVGYYRGLGYHLRRLIILIISGLLAACSLVPQSGAPTVIVAENTTVTLPAPNRLGYQLSASQLISAAWVVDGKESQQKLPVQLQISPEEVVLAGFSSWGTRILSLRYNGDAITTEVMSGLQNTLPQPEQVLYNLMLTLWPISAWEAPFNQIGWRIVEDQNSRSIFNNSGEKVIDIQYSHADRLKGNIEFHQLKEQFSISIQTLQYQLN